VFVGVFGYGSGMAANPSKIKVGILLPLTGTFGAVAETQKEGALLATRMTPQQRVALGMMRTFQLTSTFDNLSVIDNLVLSFFRAHKKSSLFHLLTNTCKRHRKDEKIVAILETFNLQDVADRQVKNLSLGEKRRLEIAMAILA